jgi:hypothetical protein
MLLAASSDVEADGSTVSSRAWRRDVDGWLALVCYAESVGLRWLEWAAVKRCENHIAR